MREIVDVTDGRRKLKALCVRPGPGESGENNERERADVHARRLPPLFVRWKRLANAAPTRWR